MNNDSWYGGIQRVYTFDEIRGMLKVGEKLEWDEGMVHICIVDIYGNLKIKFRRVLWRGYGGYYDYDPPVWEVTEIYE